VYQIFRFVLSVTLVADDFQLITWSKDRTLRFWPIDATVMEVLFSTCRFAYHYLQGAVFTESRLQT